MKFDRYMYVWNSGKYILNENIDLSLLSFFEYLFEYLLEKYNGKHYIKNTLLYICQLSNLSFVGEFSLRSFLFLKTNVSLSLKLFVSKRMENKGKTKSCSYFCIMITLENFVSNPFYSGICNIQFPYTTRRSILFLSH